MEVLTCSGLSSNAGNAVSARGGAVVVVVVDLVVEPQMTQLLTGAEARGCKVQPGLRTLEGQVDAICAFFAGGGHE
jgi:shikimate 5-dehydrogenase